MTSDDTEIQRRRNALASYLGDNFPGIDQETLQDIQNNVQWVELRAGEVLMEQGAPADAAYLTISGRLRVYVKTDDNAPRMVRELGRGEITGEISLYTDATRSATVVAIRRTVVVRLDKPHFTALVARNPKVSMALTKKIIERLQTQHDQRPLPPPVTVTLLPITGGVEAAALAQRLMQALEPFGRVCRVDSTTMTAGVASEVLEDLEAEHDFVLMVADTEANEWTELCISLSDEVLLLADATQPAAIHPVEQACMVDTPHRNEVAETLVLLHPASTQSPLGMRQWVERRPVTGHVNLRVELDGDIARLARLLSRNAVGLVLAGGGARGFAHLGVWKALDDLGIEIDCVGGTSMGAVMAAAIAADRGIPTTLDILKQAFKINPTGDYNLLPLISLIKGRRIRSIVERSIASLMGGPVDIVDLWKGYFCIASNYSQGSEMQLHKGDLGRALRASIAIPGALPPVVMDGELFCDGGTFNNFPADVMRNMRGVGKVIGVDLSARRARRLDFDEMPGAWQVFFDRLKPRAKQRYRVPSLMSYLLNVSVLYSVSRQSESRKQTDLYFNPELYRIGFLQWGRFSSIVTKGDDHAREVIGALSLAEKQAWGFREA
ncbi:patatin-like phospholipase family protein [Hydrogenophaga sp. PBL-H3]|uniref:patatin-like phospholipase family protein n=1 Tax=Hydrogenophaga sp. PBL-H3 TaxID=434010 RepID=UPI0013204919|nr:patatin-like phospholipase family protein [Hydrogenophaga sp. PBL-H3]QHE76922.1 cyclic nucleotide-binding domain-containing protein [Hydrogenophaga sp. PBL-H3]QHE81346.1 cyclic nucleotide-binding domain-containing protein [Hydrogenophaga sp. PBL-H3]